MQIKKISLVFLLISLILLQVVAVSALSADGAKQEWKNARQKTIEKREIHQESKLNWQENQSEENTQAYINTGKDLLNAALDEADAWLVLKQEEIEEINNLPTELKSQIQTDIDTNRAKVEEQREKVESANTKIQVDLTALGMVVAYLELLTDVARDSGKIQVYKSNQYIETMENYEQILRTKTENIDNNQEIISLLDNAKAEIDEAKTNVLKADLAYSQVVNPGTPLIKFNEGNQYLRVAKVNMVSANAHLRQALRLIIKN